MNLRKISDVKKVLQRWPNSNITMTLMTLMALLTLTTMMILLAMMTRKILMSLTALTTLMTQLTQLTCRPRHDPDTTPIPPETDPK